MLSKFEMAGVIRLFDSSETNLIDSISTEYEDSFSLETFGDLCKQFEESDPKGEKFFIIARIQTWDHKQPNKVNLFSYNQQFYSYYNAYELNKILFQTQLYLGKRFLHRLQVLNPLTNTDIIGHIQYFMVKSRENGTGSSPLEETPETHKSSSRAISPFKLDLPPPSPSVREIESGSKQSWTLKDGTCLNNV